MRRALSLVLLSWALGSGCATLSVCDVLITEELPLYDSSTWRRCQVAEDEEGRLRCVLTLRLYDGRERRYGDVAWFEDHPRAPLLPALSYERLLSTSWNDPIRLTDERGELSPPIQDGRSLASFSDRVVVGVTVQIEDRLVLALYRPRSPGASRGDEGEADGLSGAKRARADRELEENLNLGPGWVAGLTKAGAFFLLPFSLALDLAAAPLALAQLAVGISLVR